MMHWISRGEREEDGGRSGGTLIERVWYADMHRADMHVTGLGTRKGRHAVYDRDL